MNSSVSCVENWSAQRSTIRGFISLCGVAATNFLDKQQLAEHFHVRHTADGVSDDALGILPWFARTHGGRLAINLAR